VPEGTPLFAGEPVMTVRGPLWEAQIFETYLLATISFQTLIATKAARIVAAAEGRGVVEFGTRRAHSPEAGVLGGRAAYIGGCIGTSNALTGFRYGVPVYGTAAHSWVLAFADEQEANRELQKLLGPATIYLIDTYDTIEGARKAASLGRPLWGVRLDSGDLAGLSREVRQILDDAGLRDAKIMASGDLDEYKIHDLLAAGAPIDAFGVGTELATSADAPALGAIYKLVEIETGGAKRYTAKLSTDKITMPAAKQIFRFEDRDVIAREDERLEGKPLLRHVVAAGELIAPLPDAHAARAHAAESLARLGKPHGVEYSRVLRSLLDDIRKQMEAASV
jgi:nicotinate phosphoribosyltransferase